MGLQEAPTIWYVKLSDMGVASLASRDTSTTDLESTTLPRLSSSRRAALSLLVASFSLICAFSISPSRASVEAPTKFKTSFISWAVRGLYPSPPFWGMPASRVIRLTNFFCELRRSNSNLINLNSLSNCSMRPSTSEYFGEVDFGTGIDR